MPSHTVHHSPRESSRRKVDNGFVSKGSRELSKQGYNGRILAPIHPKLSAHNEYKDIRYSDKTKAVEGTFKLRQ